MRRSNWFLRVISRMFTPVIKLFLIKKKVTVVQRIGTCFALLFILAGPLSRDVQANPLSCPVEHQLVIDFDNGAGWNLCWESKRRENIVLSDIHYRAANRQPFKVIGTLRLAQLHVTYDDSNITYNDVTQFGLGGGYVTTLTERDCPLGELIDINGRAGLCKTYSRGVDAYRTSTEARVSEIVTLFSISQVGSYSYIVTWKFFDDGSIEPSIGAAGALQRSTDSASSPYGRELEGVPGKSWLSHTHNYYWRIDIDLGDKATDDVVSEVFYKADKAGRRARHIERLGVESARKIDPTSMLAWYITDSFGETSNPAEAPGFIIEPINYGHKLVRSALEPFTEFDFFVTRQNDCERFISENAVFNPGCGSNILEFVNDESLINEDVVAWHRVSFHHVPRNEDRYHMHSHWDGFVMQARNLSATTPGHNGVIDNSPPVLSVPDFLQSVAGEQVDMNLLASDADADALTFIATGLPDGVKLTSEGVLSGSVKASGNYRVVVRVQDAIYTSSALIQWQVSSKSGVGVMPWAFLFSLVLLRILGSKLIEDSVLSRMTWC